MSKTIGELTATLASFAKGIEAMGPVTDPMKKITIPGGASFTPAEVTQIVRVLDCFPGEMELRVVAILQGAISRALYITGQPMRPVLPLKDQVKVLPDEVGVGPAPDDEPLNVA